MDRDRRGVSLYQPPGPFAGEAQPGPGAENASTSTSATCGKLCTLLFEIAFPLVPKIFVSYRREDSPGYAGRLYDRLRGEFGSESLFIDVDTLQPGDDFVDTIQQMLNECDVVLAIIGPRWLTVLDDNQRPRLEDELDFVRLEIQTALERKIRVIPVLVERAGMPKREDLPAPLQSLLRRQAIELSDTRWAYDVSRLVENLKNRANPARVEPVESAPTASPPPKQEPEPQFDVRLKEPIVVGPPLQFKKPKAEVRKEPRPPERATPPAPAAVLPPSISVTQRLITRIDYSKWTSESLAVSPDNRRVAFVESSGGILGFGNKYVVNIDGVATSEYDSITSSLIFSADSSRIAYCAQRRGRFFAVVDGRETSTYDNLAKDLWRFSPDSRRLAFGVESSGKWRVVIDGQQGQPVDALANSNLVFSADSQHFAYSARRGNQWVTVVDDRAGRPYDGLLSGGPVFGPAGQRLAYGALRGNKWFFVVDGDEGPEFDALMSNGLLFSPDGRHFAFGARRNGQWFVVVDGQVGEPQENLMESGLLFSPDGHRFACGVHKNGRWIVRIDGKETPPHDDLMNNGLLFSPDSRHFVYGVRKDGRWIIVRDGQEGEPYDGVLKTGLVFSPDSRQLAYGALTGGKWVVVLDGRETQQYEGLGKDDLVFSPDSRHFAFSANTPSGWVAAVDGTHTSVHGGIIRGGHIVFDTPESLHLLSVSGQEVYLMTLSIQ